MTKIKAFRAIRPVRNKVHLVASRAVATYKSSVLEAKLESNPYTFIHIIHPEFSEKEGEKTDPNSVERFLKVKEKYKEFCEIDILKKDENESLYVYRQSNPKHSYLGVIGGASIQEYKDNKIKKHEATLFSREAMFTNYLQVVGFNAEPVLLSHKKSHELDDILAKIVEQRPEYEFATTDKMLHELWICNAEEVAQIQKAYEKIDACYIADGHHRTASSERLCDLYKLNPDYDPKKNYNYFLSFFIDEERLNIFSFNRICKSLNGHKPSDILKFIGKHFTISKIKNETSPYPAKMHDISMYLDSEWYQLSLKLDTHKVESVVANIDAEVLTRYILTPILGIEDLTQDENISFLSGADCHKKIKQSIDNNVNKIGFLLYPVTMEQLKSVADNNLIMPPKSTWIEPKMRSGLTIFKIDE